MQKFNTSAPITAILKIPAGRIQVIAAERADTTIEVLPANAEKSRDVKAAQQTNIEYTDGVLRVETPVKNKYIGPSGAVEVTIQLPADSAIEGKAGAAEFRAVGRFNTVVFEGAHQQLKVDEAASARLACLDGDVEVGRLGGSAEIGTLRGAIRITEAVGGKLLLRTLQGDITVGATTGVSASLDAGTTSGRIHNALKNDGTTGLDIQATTLQGDITARSS